MSLPPWMQFFNLLNVFKCKKIAPKNSEQFTVESVNKCNCIFISAIFIVNRVLSCLVPVLDLFLFVSCVEYFIKDRCN